MAEKLRNYLTFQCLASACLGEQALWPAVLQSSLPAAACAPAIGQNVFLVLITDLKVALINVTDTAWHANICLGPSVCRVKLKCHRVCRTMGDGNVVV